MFAKLFVVSTLLFATIASAAPTRSCGTRSTKITGSIVGAKFKAERNGPGTCLVRVSIESSIPNRVCPLRLKEGQEILLSVGLTEKQCPLDEGPVKGVYASGLINGFKHFRGTVDGHRVN